jgi:hypothetical protein
MTKDITRSFQIATGRRSRQEAEPATHSHAHHHHHDAHGAVRLTRPNPFRADRSGGDGG